MSDIVVRLRGNTGKYPGFENMNTEAAAEIERLRAALAAAVAERDKAQKFLAKIAKQRTVEEWKEFAEGEGLDPDGGDYTGAYDAIVREARAALAKEGT